MAASAVGEGQRVLFGRLDQAAGGELGQPAAGLLQHGLLARPEREAPLRIVRPQQPLFLVVGEGVERCDARAVEVLDVDADRGRRDDGGGDVAGVGERP